MHKKKYTANVTMFSSAVGGRRTAYRGAGGIENFINLAFRTDFKHQFIAISKQILAPGDSLKVEFSFMQELFWPQPEEQFFIMEGARAVGVGKILEVENEDTED